MKNLKCLVTLLALFGSPFVCNAAGEADAAKGNSVNPSAEEAAVPTSPSKPRVHRIHKPDSAITAAVKTKLLASPDTSGMKIHVSTKNGIVTLSGKAQSEEEKQQAQSIALGVKGVRHVRNELTVGG